MPFWITFGLFGADLILVAYILWRGVHVLAHDRIRNSGFILGALTGAFSLAAGAAALASPWMSQQQRLERAALFVIVAAIFGSLALLTRRGGSLRTS